MKQTKNTNKLNLGKETIQHLDGTLDTREMKTLVGGGNHKSAITYIPVFCS